MGIMVYSLIMGNAAFISSTVLLSWGLGLTLGSCFGSLFCDPTPLNPKTLNP